MTAMNIAWKLLPQLGAFLLFKFLILTSAKANGEIASISSLRSNLKLQPLGKEEKSRNLQELQLVPQINPSTGYSAQHDTDEQLPPLLNIKYAFRFPMISPFKKAPIQERFTVEDTRTKLDVRPFNQREPLERGEPLYGPCGMNLTGLNGIVTSPKYPYNYPPNSKCRYFIETDPSYFVSLNCRDFSIQDGDENCENDFLEIEIQPSNVTRFCGDGSFSTESLGNMSMTFHSDETFQYRGFMCRYNVLYANGSKVESSSSSGGPQNESAEEEISCLNGDLLRGWSGKCGVIMQPDTSRIVGGTEVQPHEFPWMAAIIVQCRKEPGHYCQICGGTLILHNWILTAGSCVASFTIEKLGILLGEHNLYVLTPTQKFYKPAEVFVHPKYNVPSPLNNNIALMKLRQNVQFSRYMSPICLPPLSISDFLNMLANESMRIGESELEMQTTEATAELKSLNRDSKDVLGIPDETRSPLKDILHQTLLNRSVSIYGWGKTGDVGEVDRELRRVEVEIIPNDVCNGYFGVMTEDMICTSGEGDKGPCKGDSGSPNLMKMKTGQWVQMGILSFGAATGCEKGLPSGNVLLPPYVEWIHFVTGENFMDVY